MRQKVDELDAAVHLDANDAHDVFGCPTVENRCAAVHDRYAVRRDYRLSTARTLRPFHPSAPGVRNRLVACHITTDDWGRLQSAKSPRDCALTRAGW